MYDITIKRCHAGTYRYGEYFHPDHTLVMTPECNFHHAYSVVENGMEIKYSMYAERKENDELIVSFELNVEPSPSSSSEEEEKENESFMVKRRKLAPARQDQLNFKQIYFVSF